MKIAIVSGHFMPEIGYQEVYLARALAKKNHDVRVFTSTAVSPTGSKIKKEPYEAGLTKDRSYGYEVQRLKPVFKKGAKVYARGLKKQLLTFDPDIVLCVAISKFFPIPVFLGKRPYKSIGIFGDSDEYINIGGKSALRYRLYQLSFKILKGTIYSLVLRNADKIVANIPETKNFIANVAIGSSFKNNESKIERLYLGFDDNEFYFEKESRERLRLKYQLENSLALITATRVTPKKNLEKVIDLFDNLIDKGIKLKYFIIGFQGDPYSEGLKEYINSKNNPKSFICLPFLSHSELRSYNSMADYGLWLKAAISIQEAMGTGLRVILPKKDSVNHLLDEGVNGFYFEEADFEERVEKILRDAGSGVSREELVKYNEKLSYSTLVDKIINLENY